MVHSLTLQWVSLQCKLCFLSLCKCHLIEVPLNMKQSWGLLRLRLVSWCELPAVQFVPVSPGDERWCLWDGAGNTGVELRIGDVFLGRRQRASVVCTVPMSARLGSAQLMVGLDDPKDLFQPKHLCGSVGFISLRNPCWERLKCYLSKNRAALWHHFLYTCYNLWREIDPLLSRAWKGEFQN